MPTERKKGKVARIVVDASLAVTLVLLMATAIAEDFAHEWLGMAAFALAVAHLALNRKFFGSLLRGRYGAQRIARTCVDALLFACIACLMASSLVLSQHAFAWLPFIPGVTWARPLHMLASYWGFLLAFAHAGMHVGPALMGRSQARRAAWGITCALLLGAGAAAFSLTGIGNYLFLGMQFVYLDPAIPVPGYALLYAMLAAGAATAGHLARCLASSPWKRALRVIAIRK